MSTRRAQTQYKCSVSEFFVCSFLHFSLGCVASASELQAYHMILHLPARLPSRTKQRRSELHVGQPSLGTFPQPATSSPRGVFFVFPCHTQARATLADTRVGAATPHGAMLGLCTRGKSSGLNFFGLGPKAEPGHTRLFVRALVCRVCQIGRNLNVVCGGGLVSNLCTVLWYVVHLER